MCQLHDQENKLYISYVCDYGVYVCSPEYLFVCLHILLVFIYSYIYLLAEKMNTHSTHIVCYARDHIHGHFSSWLQIGMDLFIILSK